MFWKRVLHPALQSVFWRQLGGLLRSGLPLDQALLAVGRDSESAALREVTESLRDAVEEGDTLSAALARHPREFDAGSLACIRAGERTGDLPGAVEVLASHSERSHLMRMRGRMALTYPAVLFLCSMLICWGMIGFVLPMADHLSAGLMQEKPLSFRIATGMTFALQGVFVVGIVVALLVATAYRFPGKFPGLRVLLDRSLLRLPVWSRYYRSLTMARFMRTLSLLLRSGMALHEALLLAGGASGNVVVEAETREAAGSVQDGGRAFGALRAGAAFSPATVWSLKVAEERGDFEETLGSLADYFDESAEIGSATFLTAAEPLAIAFVGVLAAATVISLAVPVFNFYATIP